MDTVMITSFQYDDSAKRLKLFYSDGSAVLFRSVPSFVHQNLLRCRDKTAFVEKYLQYNLGFTKITLQ